MSSFDAIVIGAGQAGPYLASRLAGAGKTVAFVERDLFGGTCVNTGCTPTKTMLASAYAAHMARRGGDYGFEVGGKVSVDMKRVKARRDAVVAKSRDGVEKWLRAMENCTVYTGHARFESPHEISVNGEALRAAQIFLDVGGCPLIPPIQGLDGIPYLTNRSILDLDFVPSHLIVVGGSYIALEFAQMFRRFGSEVTIVERSSRLIRKEDPDIADAVREFLEAEGIEVLLNTSFTSFAKDGDEIRAQVDRSNGSPRVRGTHVLLAVGRKPNTDDLGLEKAGVQTDSHGYIEVDDQLRTSVPHIWALGDCNGKGAFTHTAWNDGELVAANLLDDATRRVSDRILAYAIYTDPPLARVGLSEMEVRQMGRPALIGKRPMSSVARAVEKGEAVGFMKVLVDAESKNILGAAILGTGGDEAIHSILNVMYARQPYTLIQRAVPIHPTVSELIPTMLGELQPLGPAA